MSRTGTVLLLFSGLTASFAAAGCGYYQDRYFEKHSSEQARVGPYTLAPRIFACQDATVSVADTACDSYAVSIRVQLGEGTAGRDGWKQDQAVLDSLSDAFLREVAGVFQADSLVLRGVDSVESITLLPESDRFTPRRHNYFTYRFGSTDLPLRSANVAAVLHLHRAGTDERFFPDSVVWSFLSIDTVGYGVEMFRNTVRGYER